MKQTFTLLALCISLSTFAQKMSLTLNLKQDSTYSLTTNANMTIIQTMNGSQNVIGTTISGKMTHKVIAIRDTVYEMEVQYKSLAMHMDVGGKAVDFNSATGGAGDVISTLLKGLLGTPFTMVISKTGHVVEVKNMEKLYDGMFNNIPNITEAQKAQFKAQMEQSFGEKSIKSNFQDAFAMFPGVKVAVNDKWVSTNKIEAIISAQIKTTFTLTGITDKNYLVHGDAIITSVAGGDYKVSNGLPMRFVGMTGTSTADLKLDKVTGWITEAKITKMIKCNVEIKDTPQTPGGMTFPMSVSGDMTVSGN